MLVVLETLRSKIKILISHLSLGKSKKTLCRIIQKPFNQLFYIQIYDVEIEEGIEHEISFPLLSSLKGTSQIYIPSTRVLYICGSSINISDEDVEFTSSFLYSIDISKDPIKISIEVNSCFFHNYPALGLFKKENLVVVGGLSSKKCEFYSIGNKKWKSLPELPENRYGCSLYCDPVTSSVYLFGGYNCETEKCCVSILKLNMNISVKWDTLIIIENSESLGRYNTVISKKKEGHIWILGGKTKYDKTKENSDNENNGTAYIENFKKENLEEFSVVDIDMNSKMIKIKRLENKYNNIVNNFEINRIGIEGQNNCIYFFEDNILNNYANLYRVDYYQEKIIQIDRGISYPINRTEESLV